MRTRIAVVLMLGLALALAGCGKKDDKNKNKDKPVPAVKDPTPPPKPPEPTPTPPPEPKPEEQEGRNKMANCPSAVAGAETRIAKGKDAVTVTVTGKDAAAVADIQARTKKLLEASKAPDSGDIKHTGTGTGGGSLGECPVVLEGTTVTAENTKDGAKLTVKPADAKGLDDLLAKAQERQAAMARAPADPGKPASP